ncbi:thioesterase [Sutcliffiella horikoshii]|uniref:Thioesterase n=1 Tax=Sutcliffiella horikoshii TaxID=79883 RepID=A0A1Y0CNU5_9BACI|nr:hotdog domain-containing protein [Sutcliffiella horikoshii]ART76666.1 thioesterase [Sutcliffiella horikoshii]TYS58027.1 thioesterase [Sutcliffiella horikoshii]
MKPELTIGTKHSIQITVTNKMFAQFEGELVHPVYSTAMMVYHMEWASRQIILEVLEETEEGMGAEVKVKHLAPATEGTVLTIEATVVGLKKNFIITKVQIFSKDRVIGEGEVTQVILPKSKINAMID